MMTIVSPTAATPMIAIARPMLAKFAPSKKYGDLIEKNRTSAANAMTRPAPSAPNDPTQDRARLRPAAGSRRLAVAVLLRPAPLRGRFRS
jgi:hypothetical protein